MLACETLELLLHDNVLQGGSSMYIFLTRTRRLVSRQL